MTGKIHIINTNTVLKNKTIDREFSISKFVWPKKRNDYDGAVSNKFNQEN